ncbi:MAG TPA: hypothetical protein VFL76_01075 [Edaphocola sp.]|nr:hypothetical protein [Edaphocola sp.]
MKNRIILLLGAATVLGLASCSNNGQQGSYTQEQLDSIANYRADSMANVMKAQNDSIISARAADSVRRLDSIKNAQSAGVNKGSSHKKSTTTTTTTTTTTVNDASAVQKAHVRTQAEIDADKKAARFGDKAAQERLEEDAKIKKAARFDDQAAKETLEQQAAQKKADRFKR